MATIPIKEFIETENVFVVMAEFRKQGVLTRKDIERATKMDRAGWIKFMKEKAYVED